MFTERYELNFLKHIPVFRLILRFNGSTARTEVGIAKLAVFCTDCYSTQ